MIDVFLFDLAISDQRSSKVKAYYPKRTPPARCVTRPDEANAIAVSGNGSIIYVTGRANGAFDLPGYPPETIFCCEMPDAFIARLDGSGQIQWVHNCHP